jgi:glycerol kinase
MIKNANSNYILALDAGTTGMTLSCVEILRTPTSQALQIQWRESISKDFEQHFPQPGWVEHDLQQIWSTTLDCLKTLSEKCRQTIPHFEWSAIGITNQRETIGFWDRKTHQPLCPAIVWQDRRSSALCDELKKLGHEAIFQQKTGLLLDPYFSGTKIKWALDHLPAVQKAQTSNQLMVGTIDSFLVYQLTHYQSHVTDPSNASRTLLYDIHQLRWSEELCQLLGISTTVLPQVLDSNSHFGTTQGLEAYGMPSGIPITGILGDQQSALLGQACTQAGQAKCTYGTGAFLLFNTGEQAITSRSRLLTTVAWKLKDQQPIYALEGSTFVAGSLVQWLRDELKLIDHAADIEALACSVPSSDGVYFIPALTGLGAPHWNPQARGTLLGITRGTTRGHLARAALEGIAYQISDLVRAIQKDIPFALREIRVDGGASENELLMQLQSDFLGCTLQRPENIESTSLGAVMIAALGAGLFKNLDDLSHAWKCKKEFQPQLTSHERDQKLKRWDALTQQMSGLYPL